MRRRWVSVCLIVGLAVALTPGTASADEIRDGQWYLDALGIHEAHRLSQGEGVTIGVIDSGINASHPDLDGRVIDGVDLVHSTGDGFSDNHDHGTGVTSVLVGNDDANGILGIAPKATVVSVNVFPEDGPYAEPGAISEAIQWLTDYGVDVITMSIGGGGDSEANKAVKYANDHGIPVVVGVGNKYQDVGFGPEEQVGSGWGAVRGTIPVTGVNENSQFWSESLDLSLASPQPQLGLAAPATKMPVATNTGGYNTRKGTSYATPIVAGTLALIKSAYPDLDYWGQMYRLMLTTDDKGPEGYDNKYGWGIVNPLAALDDDVELQDGSVSSRTDILPLEEQGQQSDDPTDPNNEGEPTTPSSDDQALTDDDSGTPLWIPIAITAAALLIAAITLILVIRRKRGQAVTAGRPPPTQPGPTTAPPPQYQSPPHS